MDAEDMRIGITVRGVAITNKAAREYLSKLYDLVINTAVDEISRDASSGRIKSDFVSESRAKALREPYVAGEGRVRHFMTRGQMKIASVLVVTYDDIMDEQKADEPVDAYQFLNTVTAIFHEARHIKQYTDIELGGSLLGNVYLLNHLVDFGCQGLADQAYRFDPEEIDAQYMGIKNLGLRVAGMDGFKLAMFDRKDGKYVLRGEKPEDGLNKESQVDTAVCFYQTRRHEDLPEDFIGRKDGGYGSARDVLGALRSSFLEAVHIRKLDGVAYSSERERMMRGCAIKDWPAMRKEDREPLDKDDPDWYKKNLERYARYSQDIAAKCMFRNETIFRMVSEEKDGYRQNRMIASLVLASDPGGDLKDVLLELKELTGMDLSCVKSFGILPGFLKPKPKPESVVSVARRSFGEVRKAALEAEAKAADLNRLLADVWVDEKGKSDKESERNDPSVV